jgi:ABC-2 type transport system ATP-binding protein
MGDVEALTDRVMLIGKGQILYDGSFDKMKDEYNTEGLKSIEEIIAAVYEGFSL